MDTLRSPAALDLTGALRRLWQRCRQTLHPANSALDDRLEDEELTDVHALWQKPLAMEARAEEPVASTVVVPPAAAGTNLLDAVFEPAFLADEKVRQECQALAAAVMAGNRLASELIGEIFILHGAPAERVAGALKLLGVTLYKWQAERPAAQALVAPLAAWVNRRSQAAGAPNQVLLVHCGDRLDQSLHISDGRGARVSAVHGWVVLRESEKVYAKAHVTVR